MYANTLKSLQISELINLYGNIPFIFECFHNQQDSQWPEKASWKYPTKQQWNGPICFSSSLFLSFFHSFFLSFFGRASSILREPLMLVYTRNSSIFSGALHNPIAFSQLQSLARCLQPLTQKLWLLVWDAIFLICMCTL